MVLSTETATVPPPAPACGRAVGVGVALVVLVAVNDRLPPAVTEASPRYGDGRRCDDEFATAASTPVEPGALADGSAVIIAVEVAAIITFPVPLICEAVAGDVGSIAIVALDADIHIRQVGTQGAVAGGRYGHRPVGVDGDVVCLDLGARDGDLGSGLTSRAGQVTRARLAIGNLERDVAGCTKAAARNRQRGDVRTLTIVPRLIGVATLPRPVNVTLWLARSCR